MAKSAISEKDAIIVMDCDLEFSSKALMENIQTIVSQSTNEMDGGLLVSFESDQPKYSYAEIDENNIVKRTAEKEVISSHALCGAYFSLLPKILYGWLMSCWLMLHSASRNSMCLCCIITCYGKDM